MKGATQRAQRIKQLFRQLRSKLGKVARLPAGDPIMQLALGIFSRDAQEPKAREFVERLRAAVVDFNELRVVPPSEMAEIAGAGAEIRRKCEDLSRALNAIFAIEHTVSLERVQTLSKKDAAAYLERIDGLDPYSRARVRLFGFEQHAIPLDEAMLALARRDALIDEKCSHAEAQAFFERHVAEKDGVEFVTLLKKHAWAECGAAVKKGDVERIASVPPDRTSRNMLRMVSAGLAPDAPEEELAALEANQSLGDGDGDFDLDAGKPGADGDAPGDKKPARDKKKKSSARKRAAPVPASAPAAAADAAPSRRKAATAVAEKAAPKRAAGKAKRSKKDSAKARTA